MMTMYNMMMTIAYNKRSRGIKLFFKKCVKTTCLVIHTLTSTRTNVLSHFVISSLPFVL